MSMSDANLNQNGVREQELRYFGRVLAGQCHELVNALNIAHELCGLHQDTLPRACEGQTGAVERLGSMAQRIEAQIARCNAIVRGLGRFAHSVDEPMVACDARDIVERAVFFAVHQARLRQTELRAILPEGDVRLVYCSPFRLQQAIHAGIELFLEGIAEGRCIAASLTLDTAGAVVKLESADSLPCNPAAAGRIGRKLSADPPGGSRIAREGICALNFDQCADRIQRDAGGDAATLRDFLKQQLDTRMDRLLEPEGAAVHGAGIACGHDGPQLGLPQASLANREEHGQFDDVAGITRRQWLVDGVSEAAKGPDNGVDRAIWAATRRARLPSFSTAPGRSRTRAGECPHASRKAHARY